MAPVSPAFLVWRDDATPLSSRFQDIYFSPENGLAETRHVFLAGTDLPQAWAKRSRFVIGETGFGTGLNFLAAWDLWRKTGPTTGYLHFVSVEGYPLSRTELARAHRAFPELAPLSAKLIGALGAPLPGFHRFHFDDDRVHLTLLHGEALSMLAALEARVDAWFLDGFAPSRNGAMWRPDVIREIARLSVPGARLATFTVAGQVRRTLEQEGFDLERRPGYGRKRDMLTARFRGAPRVRRGPFWARLPNPRPEDHRPRRALVAGAGIAGASVAAALRRRNVATTVVDRADASARGASGNPAGIVMPRLTVDPTPAGRFHMAAFQYTTRHMPAGAWIGGAPSGVLQLATSLRDWLRHRALVLHEALPRGLLRCVGRTEASALAGLPVDRPGLFFPTAGAVSPPDLVAGFLGDTPVEGETVTIDQGGRAVSSRHGPIEDIDAFFATNAMGVADLAGGARLGLRPSRGQLIRVDGTEASSELRRVVTFGSYVAPGPDGSVVAGATYAPVDDAGAPVDPCPADTQQILCAVEQVFPDLARVMKSGAVQPVSALRATTADHMPMAGPMPDFEALESNRTCLDQAPETADLPTDDWPFLTLCTGLGSRGLVTAPLLAEWLVSAQFGDPWPIERDLAEALHPARFQVRAMRRGEA